MEFETEIKIVRGFQVAGSMIKNQASVTIGHDNGAVTLSGSKKTLRKALAEALEVLDEMNEA